MDTLKDAFSCIFTNCKNANSVRCKESAWCQAFRLREPAQGLAKLPQPVLPASASIKFLD